MLKLRLEHGGPHPLNLPPLLRSPPGGLEDPAKRLPVLEPHGLLRRLDPHPALFVHGDGLALLHAGALGHKRRRESRVPGLQREVEERLRRGEEEEKKLDFSFFKKSCFRSLSRFGRGTLTSQPIGLRLVFATSAISSQSRFATSARKLMHTLAIR